MRTLALSLVSASLLALTACGGATEANNTSANTLGAETLPPLDTGTDLGNTGAADLNSSGNSALETNVSTNATLGNSATATNTVGNSQ